METRQAQVVAPACVGRQPITLADGTPIAYELLHRSVPAAAIPVDRWEPADQDGATLGVLAAATTLGVDRLGGGRTLFVNMTEQLLGRDGLRTAEPALPARIGIEVLETVRATPDVRWTLTDLRARGHVVALDDWTASDDQRALLPLVDVVKIDIRDLSLGGASLLDSARAFGALTVVERVETSAQLARCVDLGFDFFQGLLLGPVQILRVRQPAGAAA